MIDIFTDGSYKKTQNGAKCGYGIYFPNKEFPNISRPFKRGKKTNQRAELFAIYTALVIINKAKTNKKINIYSDSEYAIKSLVFWASKWEKNKWLTSKGYPVDNQDIIKPLYYLYKRMKSQISLYHVISHTNKNDYLSNGNMEADKLAKKGAEKDNENL